MLLELGVLRINDAGCGVGINMASEDRVSHRMDGGGPAEVLAGIDLLLSTPGCPPVIRQRREQLVSSLALMRQVEDLVRVPVEVRWDPPGDARDFFDKADIEPPPVTFGSLLRGHRGEVAGDTVAAKGRQAARWVKGIERSTISKWERGHLVPTLPQLVVLAHAYGLGPQQTMDLVQAGAMSKQRRIEYVGWVAVWIHRGPVERWDVFRSFMVATYPQLEGVLARWE